MDALSELGGAGEPTAWLFNGGLVAGSLLSVLSLWAVWRTRENALDTVGCVGLTISLVAMGLVGVFPVGTDLHLPMAVTFFGAFTYALFFFGSGRVLAGEPRFGLASLWLGIAHVTSWVVWAAGLRPGPGLALPETVGALILVVWMVRTIRRL